MAQTHDHTTQHICPACSFGPFTRNNYFTGKLLVERDFTDEARFHMEKLRHHEQQLHGWGVVCGLKVTPHPNQACQDRFVCVEPGSAVDCCGYDIIVREKECFDFTQTPAIKELQAQNDTNAHTLQICVRFRECPTEEIPVLYDDCGCDDTKCAPNRILESYELDVMVDPPPPPDSPHSPELVWNNSVTLLADVSRVALHDASHRLYLLVGDDVYQVDTTPPIVGPNCHLAAKGLEIAISNSGDHLFVVTEPPAGSVTSFRQLVVVKTSDMSQVRVLDIPDSVSRNIRPVVASDHRLMMLVTPSGAGHSQVLIWGTDLTDPAVPANPAKVVLTSNLQNLAVAGDAAHAYAVGPGANAIKVVNTTGTPSAGADIPILSAAAKPTAIAVVRTTGPDLLAITDNDGKKLYLVRPDLVNPNASQLFPAVSLDHPPVELAISNGGHWGYVLERETAAPEKSFIQAVDLFQLSQNQAVTAGASLQVGDASQQIVISASGTFLYLPYLGATSNAFDGGVAKVEIGILACEDILWRHLEGCPHCDIPNCVVLATIENYHIGDKVEAQTDPPADPNDPLNKNIARIDNRRGRRLLPSTQVLTELVECLLEHGTGGAGTQGPPGIQGPKGDNGDPGTPGGPGLDDVKLELVSCDQAAVATIVTQTDGKRVLNLIVPSGCAPEKLTHICDISWQHGQVLSLVQDQGLVLTIAFDKPVQRSDLHRQSLRVLHEHQEGDGRVFCWCELPIKIQPGGLEEPCKAKSKFFDSIDPAVTTVTAVQLRLDPASVLPGEYRVTVHGDLIRDKEGKAIDANHVPPWFNTATYLTGDGVAGGMFESWFSLTQG